MDLTAERMPLEAVMTDVHLMTRTALHITAVWQGLPMSGVVDLTGYDCPVSVAQLAVQMQRYLGRTLQEVGEMEIDEEAR